MEIYYFSSISYGFLRQRPQQLFEALAQRGTAEGHRVYYVDPPRIELRVFQGREATHLLGLPPADPDFARVVRRLVGGIPGSKRKDRAAISSVFWEPFINKREFSLICYDYFDLIDPADRIGLLYLERHRRFLAKSDLVLATTRDFAREASAAGSGAEVLVVSNGVDPDFFAQNAGRPVAGFQKNGPVVGFLGAISVYVDMESIFRLARSLPAADFLLVGPVTAPSGFPGKPENVHFLGWKDYGEVPACLSLFDVALMPFKETAVVAAADPVSFYECFALGKPVVASRSLRQLAPYDDGRLLMMAGSAGEMLAAVEHFLRNDMPAWQEERRRIARANTWDGKAALILAALERRRSRGFEKGRIP